MVEVSASILNIGDKRLEDVVLNLEIGKVDYLHIDIMDGKFVKKDTYNSMLEAMMKIRGVSSSHIDVHLMCKDIDQSIDDVIGAEPNIITFHVEACEGEEEVFKYINKIKESSARVGISIKPETKIETIYEYLPYIHSVLVMTVEPGKGGQTYLSEMTNKIKTLKEYIDKKDLNVDIAADGGINLVTAPMVKQAGANVLVAGAGILRAVDYGVIIKELKQSN